MAPTIDIRSWKVFKGLDPTFIADIRMAMVVSKKINTEAENFYTVPFIVFSFRFINFFPSKLEQFFFSLSGHGEAGIMVMRNDDVLIIGSSDEQLLGLKGKTTTKVPLKIKQLSGTKIKGS